MQVRKEMKIIWIPFFHQESTRKMDHSGWNMFLQLPQLESMSSTSKIYSIKNFNLDRQERLAFALSEKNSILNVLTNWLDKLQLIVPKEDSFLLE